MKRIGTAILVTLASILTACGTPPTKDESRPPAGAIKVDKGLYQIPVAKDHTGCQQYTLWAVDGEAITVIWYRRKDGSFTMDRREADCK